MKNYQVRRDVEGLPPYIAYTGTFRQCVDYLIEGLGHMTIQQVFLQLGFSVAPVTLPELVNLERKKVQ